MKSLRMCGSIYLFSLGVLSLPSFASAMSASEPQVQFFPHFADGAGYATSWHFTGYGSGPSTIDVELFNKDGSRLSLATDQGTDNIFHLSLAGYGSTSLRTLGGSGPLKTGWVRITSSAPVGAMETFSAVGSHGLISQASVLPGGAIVSATLLVPDPGSTAIAVSTGSSNSLSFKMLDRSGNIAATKSDYPLPANSQLALYVNQIPGFERLNLTDGSLELTGSAPFFVTSLLFDGESYATAPVLGGRSAPAGSRSALVNQFNITLQQLKDVGDQLLPPSAEDLASFAAFLSQPQTGLIRLLPRETYDGRLTIRGGGAYYAFALRTHEYGYGSDIELQQGYFSVGFAGADFGFMTSLGDVPIDGITLNTPAVQYLAQYRPPTNLSDARTQQERASTGFSAGGYNYIDRMKAAAANSFALRSICYDTSDVLVAFRVIRFDTDGSAILVWKMLQAFEVPRLQ